MMNISKVGIIGAGTMGEGIAYICAKAGYTRVLFDIDAMKANNAHANIEKLIDKSIANGKATAADKEIILSKITISSKLEEVVVDLVIEAIVERLDVKKKLFSDLEAINSESTIFTSNTSSIPITQIAAGLKSPERMAGLHFFNPAHIMKLVELISSAATQADIIVDLMLFSKSLGKEAVLVQDSPGFIVNRVARHYYVESLKLMEEGVADFTQIDNLMESSGFKMGPFKLMDLIGIDTNYSVTNSLFESFNYDPKFRPNRIQKQKLDAGYLGKKTGIGFYKY